MSESNYLDDYNCPATWSITKEEQLVVDELNCGRLREEVGEFTSNLSQEALEQLNEVVAQAILGMFEDGKSYGKELDNEAREFVNKLFPQVLKSIQHRNWIEEKTQYDEVA